MVYFNSAFSDISEGNRQHCYQDWSDSWWPSEGKHLARFYDLLLLQKSVWNEMELSDRIFFHIDSCSMIAEVGHVMVNHVIWPACDLSDLAQQTFNDKRYQYFFSFQVLLAPGQLYCSLQERNIFTFIIMPWMLRWKQDIMTISMWIKYNNIMIFSQANVNQFKLKPCPVNLVLVLCWSPPAPEKKSLGCWILWYVYYLVCWSFGARQLHSGLNKVFSLKTTKTRLKSEVRLDQNSEVMGHITNT